MHNIARILGMAAILATGQAYAAEAVKPGEINSYIQSESAYGQGNYTTMIFNVYDAALWTDAQTWSMNEPFALVLTYHMHLKSKEIVSRSIKDMQSQQSFSATDKATYAAKLSQIVPDVHSGDVITDMYMPSKGSIFYFNGRIIGRITDDAFAQRFLGIWLSSKTSDPRLREQLLNRG